MNERKNAFMRLILLNQQMVYVQVYYIYKGFNNNDPCIYQKMDDK